MKTTIILVAVCCLFSNGQGYKVLTPESKECILMLNGSAEEIQEIHNTLEREHFELGLTDEEKNATDDCFIYPKVKDQKYDGKDVTFNKACVICSVLPLEKAKLLADIINRFMLASYFASNCDRENVEKVASCIAWKTFEEVKFTPASKKCIEKLNASPQEIQNIQNTLGNSVKALNLTAEEQMVINECVHHPKLEDQKYDGKDVKVNEDCVNCSGILPLEKAKLLAKIINRFMLASYFASNCDRENVGKVASCIAWTTIKGKKFTPASKKCIEKLNASPQEIQNIFNTLGKSVKDLNLTAEEQMVIKRCVHHPELEDQKYDGKDVTINKTCVELLQNSTLKIVETYTSIVNGYMKASLVASHGVRDDVEKVSNCIDWF